MAPPLSLYVHIPWCIKKCPYCDFNSHAVKSGAPESAYVNALLDDLHCDVERFAINRPIQTIFIGGGTPSLFAPESIAKLLAGIKKSITIAEDAEITLEANPGTFESAKFNEFNQLGINRLSIGVQSFHDRLLTTLGRVHSGQEAVKAAEIAHQAGFSNFNLDLMFGLPDATPEESINDIKTAIQLTPAHISFYQLTLEPNTLFHKYPPKLPDDETTYLIQKQCQELLVENGYRQYEISAYAKSGKQCRHNINYWQFGDYIGIGAGAHGKLSLSLPENIIRTSKPKKPELYLADPSKRTEQLISLQELPLEFLMNQLRLRQGFSLTGFTAKTGLMPSDMQPGLLNCLEKNLIECVDNHYRCSEKGWDFLDSILQNFIN